MRRAARLALVLAAVAPGVGPPAVHAEQPIVLAPLTVTGTRLPDADAAPIGARTVMTRAAIIERAPTTTVELLRAIPGVHIDQPGGPGGTSSIYTRGGEANYTQVMIDGIKVNDPTNSRGGSFDVSTIDPFEIERVEILRGPYASVYGSDAMAGVVNIVTRRGGARPEHDVDVSGGRFGGYALAAGSRGPAGESRYALSASVRDSGEPVEGSRLRAQRAGFALDGSLAPSVSFDLTGRLVAWDATSFPDDSGGPSFATLRDLDRRDALDATAGLGISAETAPGWTLDLDFSYARHEEDFASPGVAPGVRDPFGIPPNTADTRFDRYDAGISAAGRVIDDVAVVVGADVQREDGLSDGALDLGGFALPTRFALTRDQWAVFAEASWTPWPGTELQAGWRRDDAEGFDAAHSPRFAASHTFATTGTTLRAAWGKGFKLPSFFALGHPIVGNPALAPERSESVEVGLSHVVLDGRGTLDLTLFDAAYDDAIDFDPGPPPLLVNRSRLDVQGVELAAALALSDTVDLDAAVTFTEAEVRETDTAPRNRPRWRASGTLSWRPRADLALTIGAVHVGSVRDSSIPTGDVNLDPFTRVDLGARWFVTADAELYLAVQNALDTRYEEFVGFEASGILPRVGARLRF